MTLPKVGVLTFHRSINYGSFWQAARLVEGLRARGHDAVVLDHNCGAVCTAEMRCALQPELPQRTRPAFLKSYATKARKLGDAMDGLPLSSRFPLQKPELAGDYDIIVVGSDEVWNFRHPWFGSKPIFFGDDLRTPRLVSYAASFGNHGRQDGISDDWARKLGRFASLSVRDGNSEALVRDGTARHAPIVLDPCFQFPPRVDARDPAGSGHAIVYGHGFPDWLKQAVRSWADCRGVRLVSIGYANDWSDEQRIDASPFEFSEAMAGARAVITNFFHGCVFALLHGKPWVSAPSAYRSIKIPDLAALFGTEHRIVREDSPASDIGELLDLPVEARVTHRIEELRTSSGDYLDEALS
jgi:hypothetical protein